MFNRGGRRVAVQKPEDEGQHEGENAPEEQSRLAAIGPYRPSDHSGAGARAERRHVARQITVARIGVGPDESEPAQLAFDRSSAGAGEDVDARTGRVERQRVGEPRPSGLDLVTL